jgi:hypothetical protein
MFKSLVILSISTACLWAAPSSYNILKLPPGDSIKVDGNLAEWPEAYLIDSIQSEKNIYCADDTMLPWTRDKLQFYVYAAHDDANVYWAVKVMADNLIKVCGTYGCDCINVNPSGQAAAFYVWSNNTIQRNPSNPYTLGVNFNGKCNSVGNGNLPTYEFFIARPVLDQFGLGSWQIAVGMEDDDRIYLYVGMDYPGTKTANACWNSCCGMNQLYFPTWIASDTVGPPLIAAVERKSEATAACDTVSANPNPFNPATAISFANPSSNATVIILDMNGRIAGRFDNVRGRSLEWNAANQPSGVYLVKVQAAGKVFSKRICLVK